MSRICALRTLLPAVLLVAGLPAVAGKPIDETRPLDADGRVRIANTKGHIDVRTWNRNEVRVTGSLGQGAQKLEIEGDRRSLSVRVVNPDKGGWFGWGDSRAEPSDIEVTLPVKAEVSVEGVSAEIDIRGVAGKRLDVDNVSGDVDVADARPEEAGFDNVSGDLTLRLDSGKVEVDTVSGDVRLEGRIDGEVALDAVSGSIVLHAGTLERLTTNTVSGDTEVRAALARSGRVQAETLSGNLTLVLPKATSARLNIETFSGDIRSDAGEVVRPEHGPGSTLETRIGDGDGQIRLESFSGDVRLRIE